eukprot:9436199-Heterocapsa_arctica.AAC.1
MVVDGRRNPRGPGLVGVEDEEVRLDGALQFRGPAKPFHMPETTSNVGLVEQPQDAGPVGTSPVVAGAC